MSDWIEALGDRTGPLGASARAFLSRRGGEVVQGADAIGLIAQAVDELAHDESASDDEDTRVVEDGGALLGLVLIERFGGRHARRDRDHRILIGEFGTFDPFGAIDAALDAADPAEKLRERIRTAEAEGRGRGPIARVVRAFSLALIDRGLDQQIQDRFELELQLEGGIEIDLRRIAEATEELDDDAVRAAANRLVALLPGAEGEAGVPWADAEARLLPRLVGASFLETLGERASELHLRQLGHDVHVALQLRYEGRCRYARRDEVIRWRDEGALPFARAIENLAARSNDTRFACVDTDEGALILGRTGDGLDSARLLLPTLRDVLARELDEPIYLAVPHRDTILAASDPALVARHAADASARAPHPISTALFRATESGVEPA